MPLIYVNCPEDTFTTEARDSLADEITTIIVRESGLKPTPFIRNATWIYFRSYPADHVYHGGARGRTKVISLEVNVYEGACDARAKEQLVSALTDSIRRRAAVQDDNVTPVYIVIREIPSLNWSIFGETMTLGELQNPQIEVSVLGFALCAVTVADLAALCRRRGRHVHGDLFDTLRLAGP